jgi:RHH-type rel operon transcriptional repressor/antitoxin RelB
MSDLPMVGARVTQEWREQIRAIALAAGRKEAEIVREALGQYLNQTDGASVKGAIADLQDRVANVERKLASLGRLVG